MRLVLRRCISCRKLLDRKLLIRVIKKENELLVQSNNAAGRSAYLCRNEKCQVAAKKEKKFEKVLKIALPANFWERLEREKDG